MVVKWFQKNFYFSCLYIEMPKWKIWKYSSKLIIFLQITLHPLLAHNFRSVLLPILLGVWPAPAFRRKWFFKLRDFLDQIVNVWNIKRFTLSACKHKGIRKFDLDASNQLLEILWSLGILTLIYRDYPGPQGARRNSLALLLALPVWVRAIVCREHISLSLGIQRIVGYSQLWKLFIKLLDSLDLKWFGLRFYLTNYTCIFLS